MGLAQRLAGLAEQVGGALGGQRAEALDQRFQVEPLQQLHHQEEGPVLGGAEVVQIDGVGRAERGGGLGLTPEALDHHPGLVRGTRPQHFSADDLHRRGSGQHPVAGAIHFAHPALAEHFLELIAPQLPGPAASAGPYGE